jgi:hypothetical protein
LYSNVCGKDVNSEHFDHFLMPIGIASYCSGTDFSVFGTRRTRAIYFAYTTKGRFITSQASDKRAIYRALISSLTNEIEMTALFRSARSDTFQLTCATSPLPTSAGAHIPAGRELMVLAAPCNTNI